MQINNEEAISVPNSIVPVLIDLWHPFPGRNRIIFRVPEKEGKIFQSSNIPDIFAENDEPPDFNDGPLFLIPGNRDCL